VFIGVHLWQLFFLFFAPLFLWSFARVLNQILAARGAGLAKRVAKKQRTKEAKKKCRRMLATDEEDEHR
jgi:hypothetical protein